MADITPHPVLLANAGGLGEQEDVPKTLAREEQGASRKQARCERIKVFRIYRGRGCLGFRESRGVGHLATGAHGERELKNPRNRTNEQAQNQTRGTKARSCTCNTSPTPQFETPSAKSESKTRSPNHYSLNTNSQDPNTARNGGQGACPLRQGRV